LEVCPQAGVVSRLCAGSVRIFLPQDRVVLYAACGAYDLSRNTGLKLSTLRRYFIGNGFLVWMLSPINILLDLLSLPYINKGVSIAWKICRRTIRTK
jgi:hypothetical protein